MQRSLTAERLRGLDVPLLPRVSVSVWCDRVCASVLVCVDVDSSPAWERAADGHMASYVKRVSVRWTVCI